ncbi:helix-turn-helix transcriptional regulator [Paenibacillus pinisoli]|uniref:helix-turn-helix transcriptional regulator n=1 Tax=Paenibacillus pinisoli TaxID=1276110 RepID=UPI0026BB8CD4
MGKTTSLDLEYMRDRRQELNIPLQEMAESLGFKNASTYLKYEVGESALKAEQLPIVARKLKCKMENFFKFNFAEIAKKVEADCVEE